MKVKFCRLMDIGSLMIIAFVVVLSGRWSCCHSSATGNGSGSACGDVISAYLGAAYECLADEFHAKSTCEGDKLKLSCSRGKYLAIHSADIFFSSTPECPAESAYLRSDQPDCLPVCVRQTFVNYCQGKRRCFVETEAALVPFVFNDACLLNEANRRSTIRVIYTCVAKYLLKFIANSSVHSSSSSSSPPDPCDPDGPADRRSKPTIPGHVSRKSSTVLKTASLSPTDAAAVTSSSPTGDGSRSSSEFSTTTTTTTTTSRASAGLSMSNAMVGSVGNGGAKLEIEIPSESLPFDTNGDSSLTTTTVTMETEADAGPTTSDVDGLQPRRWSDAWWYYLSTEWTWSYRHIADNQEKFLLYVALGISLGFIFVLFAVVLRLSTKKSVLASISHPHANHHHHHHHHHRPLSSKSEHGSSTVLQPLTMSCTSPITWRLPDIDPSIAGDDPPGRGCEIRLTSFNRINNSLPRVRQHQQQQQDEGSGGMDAGLSLPSPSTSSPAAVVGVVGADTTPMSNSVKTMTSTTATISRSHLNFIDSHSIGQPHGESLSGPPSTTPDPTSEEGNKTVSMGNGGTAGTFPPPKFNNHLFHIHHQYSMSAVSVRPITKFGSFGRTRGGPCGQEFRELNDMAQLSKTLELPIGNRYFCT